MKCNRCGCEIDERQGFILGFGYVTHSMQGCIDELKRKIERLEEKYIDHKQEVCYNRDISCKDRIETDE